MGVMLGTLVPLVVVVYGDRDGDDANLCRIACDLPERGLLDIWRVYSMPGKRAPRFVFQRLGSRAAMAQQGRGWVT